MMRESVLSPGSCEEKKMSVNLNKRNKGNAVDIGTSKMCNLALLQIQVRYYDHFKTKSMNLKLTQLEQQRQMHCLLLVQYIGRVVLNLTWWESYRLTLNENMYRLLLRISG